MKSEFVDVDALVWGSLRSSSNVDDVGAGGVEARATLRPGVEGLSVQAVVAAVAADDEIWG
jgi:hypothetical protein